MSNHSNTEKNIINAARKVFYRKGFKEATMRDIAAEAKTNLAMVNYYFRSKENLFCIIFDDTWAILMDKMKNNVENEKMNVAEKIALRIGEQVRKNNIVKTFNQQVEKEVNQGKIKAVSGFSIFINLHSLIIFPILAKPIFQNTLEMEPSVLQEQLIARKKEVTEILVDSIRLK